ncbi:S-adenosylmethionine decarboxylase proenzyme [subsurface metagenome]
MNIKKRNSTGTATSGSSSSGLSKEFGSHFLVELINCTPDRLRKVKDVKQIMRQVIQKSKSTMVRSSFHQFQPEGVTGMILIRESHIAIHTWPEEGYVAADIFTCGQEMDPYIAIEVMKDRFEAMEVRYQIIKRGF